MRLGSAALLLTALVFSTIVPPVMAKVGITLLSIWGGSGVNLGLGVTSDIFGNVYVTGLTNTSTARGYDVLLLKFDASGTLIWEKNWGTNSTDSGSAITTDASGNVYVTGQAFSSVGENTILLKFNSSGGIIWQRMWEYGLGDSDGYSIATDNIGNVYVSSQYTSISFQRTSKIFLLKFNSTGNLLWQREFGDLNYNYGLSIVADAQGNVFLSGSHRSGAFLMRLNSTGSTVWLRHWDVGSAFGLVQDSLGDFYMTGSGTFDGGQKIDAYIMKLNSSGGLIWERSWGDSGNDFGYGVELDSAQNVYVTGTYNQTGVGAIFLLKIDPSGTLLSRVTWGSNKVYDYNPISHCVFSCQHYSSIAIDPSDNPFIAGSVVAAPPYNSGLGNSTLGTSNIAPFDCYFPSNGTATGTVSIPIGTVMNAAGSQVYSGGSDIFLLRYGTLPANTPLTFHTMLLMMGFVAVAVFFLRRSKER